jgi:glutathione S-transferase
MDKREVAYTQARMDLLNEMLSAGAFDMDADERRDFVAATVRDIAARYPELDDHLRRQLMGNGIRATYGDAAMAMAAREGRGEQL